MLTQTSTRPPDLVKLMLWLMRCDPDEQNRIADELRRRMEAWKSEHPEAARS
jgi:hypothetical protein